MSGRTIIIGDLHGCIDEALELLNKVQATTADRVIFLGDLVDRGEASDKCIDLAMDIERMQGSSACVLGNHEETHLRYEDVFNMTGILPDNLRGTHAATRAVLRPEHFDYIRSMPTYIRLPEFNAVCVHAGVWPGRRIEDQKRRHLLHVQCINPSLNDEKSLWPSKVKGAPGWKFWTNFWDGPERIIFGHSVLDVPLVTDKVVGIDGGAVFGLKLHALVLPEWRVVSVDGRSDRGRGKRGAEASSIASFLVHGDVATFS